MALKLDALRVGALEFLGESLDLTLETVETDEVVAAALDMLLNLLDLLTSSGEFQLHLQLSEENLLDDRRAGFFLGSRGNDDLVDPIEFLL